MNEALEIIKKMWTEDNVSYSGKHYCVIDAVCEPKPLQRPNPTLIVCGGGEKLTLKVTARHADRYDWGYLSSFEEYTRKLRILKNHCDAVGRRFSDIEKSCWPSGQVLIGETKKELEKKASNWLPKGISFKDFMRTNFVGTPDDYLKQLQKYINLGVTHFMLFFGDFPDLTGLQLFAKKIFSKLC